MDKLLSAAARHLIGRPQLILNKDFATEHSTQPVVGIVLGGVPPLPVSWIIGILSTKFLLKSLAHLVDNRNLLLVQSHGRSAQVYER